MSHTNPSKERGSRFEVEVVDFLRNNGFPGVERRAMRGSRDTGDVSGLPGWVLEVKNCRAMSLGEWVAEAEKEAKNAQNGAENAVSWAVVHKRRQKGPGGAYVTLSLELFANLLVAIDG